MGTLHRKDITRDDFALLAKFSWLYQHHDPENQNLNFGYFYMLGEVDMWLPVWYLGYEWQLSKYKPYKREAIGIETSSFRRICRYLKTRESTLVGTLFRLSMLSVVPGQKHYDPPKFRMEFHGDIKGYEVYAPSETGNGFIIERRRLEGGFRIR